jgi:hypothetical protein
MAGERKGITYEAILYRVLLRLLKKRKLKGGVFWNETPDGMTIEPDLLVGPDKNHPTALFLVTHSGSAGDSHKKFWRNLGELVEAKTQLATVPCVYNVAFDSVIKESLKKVQAAAFDGQLIVGDEDYGKALQAWVDTNNKSLPQERFEKADAVKNAAGGKGLSGPIAKLEADVAKLIGSTNTSMKSVWALERKRPKGKAPTARDTFLRRGVGKLLLFDRPDQVDRQGRFVDGTPEGLIESLKTMGLARDSIGGPRISDREMWWALRTLTSVQLAALWSAKDIPRVIEWVEVLRGMGSLEPRLAYIAKHWKVLTQSEGLFQELVRCHADSTSDRVWLFHFLIEWIKINGGSRTAYGLARVVSDLERLSKDKLHRQSVEAILGRPAIWHAKHTIGLGLTDWHSTASEQEFAFVDDDLARVADVLARRLAECQPPKPSTDHERFSEAVVQSTLEAKLLTYRNFQFFQNLLRVALEKQNHPWEIVKAVPACFAQAARAEGVKIDPRSGGTTVMMVNNTLINWQSAHGSHTNDKKKELCGRAVGLRYSWDAKSKTFIKRPGVDKLILVVDGTWTQSNLDALVRSGWDEIFYPDEMDELAAAIV